MSFLSANRISCADWADREDIACVILAASFVASPSFSVFLFVLSLFPGSSCLNSLKSHPGCFSLARPPLSSSIGGSAPLPPLLLF
ncbi:hypothetical protein BS47DRAFT_911073 [Hydnum rufescens UP504]|uniref:Uncharacterized protein n=1 Tax=Hydnum rufescens UP504 TaxID=1448309 RepID=A0A9P6AXM6_9AGAM|nr:hypothetical protein BS47DRAFT_911073 [Hydnum rufescens UP504]